MAREKTPEEPVKDENGNVTGEKPGEKTISVQVP